jgi:hypothetical protein
MTWRIYAADLGRNLTDLHARVHRAEFASSCREALQVENSWEAQMRTLAVLLDRALPRPAPALMVRTMVSRGSTIEFDGVFSPVDQRLPLRIT